MGEKWTHYGYRGTYGSFGTNGLYRENPWANNPNKNYVVPFYFDQNHSIDDQTKKDSGSTSFLNFFNECMILWLSKVTRIDIFLACINRLV